MDYSTLCTQVQNYVENSFTTDQLNVFIEQAEQRILNTVQLPDLRKNVTGTTAGNNKYVACPDDFLSVFSFAVIGSDGSYTYLLNKDVNFIREAYPDPNSLGMPRYYGIFGPQSNNNKELTFILGPTPDVPYGLELHYFHYPESIVTAGTSWLGDNYDMVLLWGTILEAYHYLKGEPDLIAAYDKRYQEALAQLKQLGDSKNQKDMYRSGQVRYPTV